MLVYMLTYRGYIDGIHVTIYSSTMDPMGYRCMLDASSPSCEARYWVMGPPMVLMAVVPALAGTKSAGDGHQWRVILRTSTGIIAGTLW